MICRRGDSNPHELPHTPLKRARLPVPPLRLFLQVIKNRACRSSSAAVYFFFEGSGDGVRVVDVGTANGTNGVGVGVAAGVGDACSVCSGRPDCRTELVPVIAGNDRIMAINMNATAEPMVIFDNTVWVPRGPNAVLDTELENSAPASALPG